MPIAFSVMTWNVENLYPCDDKSESGPRTPEVYQQKMSNLARTILAISPDVLALQEIGDPATFADLQGRLHDRYPFNRLSRYPDVRGIRVGILSRMPLLQAQEYHDFPTGALTNIPDPEGKIMSTLGRGALKVTVVISPGVLVNVVTVHLKSKLVTYEHGRRYPLDEDERARSTALALIKRAAEAVAVRVQINRLVEHNNDPLVLMGDFNDGGDAITTQLLLGPEDRSLALRDKFDDIRLYNLDEHIPAERRYSRMYHKSKELIDHIMVSHELIFYLRQADSYVEPISSIDADIASRRDAVYPDHAPLFARFEIPEEEVEQHFATTR
jgi:endonuclease/exonuclease/phosphatase family metal-dependent hydrolase